MSSDEQERGNDRIVVDDHECIPQTDQTTDVDRCQLCGGVMDS